MAYLLIEIHTNSLHYAIRVDMLPNADTNLDANKIIRGLGPGDVIAV